jgi:hypothetical protein
MISCRMVACREALDDGKEWSFYLINDTAYVVDSVVLYQVCYEWGDFGSSEAADVRVSGLAPRAHALLWRDDGSGAELNMDLLVRWCAANNEMRLRFEFPKLYRKRALPVVAGLDKAGFAVAPCAHA